MINDYFLKNDRNNILTFRVQAKYFSLNADNGERSGPFLASAAISAHFSGGQLASDVDFPIDQNKVDDK